MLPLVVLLLFATEPLKALRFDPSGYLLSSEVGRDSREVCLPIDTDWLGATVPGEIREDTTGVSEDQVVGAAFAMYING
jgi:hypothetical protein